MIEQFVDTYLNKETHHDKVGRIGRKEAIKYYQHLLNCNRLNYLFVEEKLVGYIESFRLDQDQLRRMFKHGLCIYNEDISDGDILYINNYWTEEEDRETIVRLLNQELCEINKGFKLMAWHRESRGRGLQVIEADKIMRKWGVEI